MLEERPSAYIQYLKRGPFPGLIDVWAEAGRYFQQAHSGMIDHILGQIQDPLLEKGYLAGKETSLQVIEGRQPDVFVRRDALSFTEKGVAKWNYVAAAEAVLAEPGIQAELPELQALFVTEFKSGELVAVLEIISPSKKSQPYLISEYQERRGQLLVGRGVNVVEIDATRSVKRVLEHELTLAHAYHTAIYLPLEWPRVLANDYGQPLKRFALPLRGQAVGVEPQDAYNHAYRSAAIAGHIAHEKRYEEEDLPFPTLLTAQQRKSALAAVSTWQAELIRLQQG
jgi:hypothetical protein